MAFRASSQHSSSKFGSAFGLRLISDLSVSAKVVIFIRNSHTFWKEKKRSEHNLIVFSSHGAIPFPVIFCIIVKITPHFCSFGIIA